MTEGQRRSEPISFVRPDPTEHVLLVAKVGPRYGVIKNTENFKPTGTEFATEDDLREAGFVRKEDAETWRMVAFRAYAAMAILDASAERMQYAVEPLPGAHRALMAAKLEETVTEQRETLPAYEIYQSNDEEPDGTNGAQDEETPDEE